MRENSTASRIIAGVISLAIILQVVWLVVAKNASGTASPSYDVVGRKYAFDPSQLPDDQRPGWEIGE